MTKKIYSNDLHIDWIDNNHFNIEVMIKNKRFSNTFETTDIMPHASHILGSFEKTDICYEYEIDDNECRLTYFTDGRYNESLTLCDFKSSTEQRIAELQEEIDRLSLELDIYNEKYSQMHDKSDDVKE